MTIAEVQGSGPQPSDVLGLNSPDPDIRLKYTLETFKRLTASPTFIDIIRSLGHEKRQERFVHDYANLVNTGDRIPSSRGLKFTPLGWDQEKIADASTARVSSPVKGVGVLAIETPPDHRIIDGGYVRWGYVSREEGAALRRLADQNGDFLRMAIITGELLSGDLKGLVLATHQEIPKLRPEGFFSGYSRQFNGVTTYDAMRSDNLFGFSFNSKERGRKEERWTIVPTQESVAGIILVGKVVNSRILQS